MVRVVRKRFLLMAFLIGISGVVFSQETKKLTLREAIEYAIENSNSTSKARLDEVESEYKIKEIRSAALPQVNAFGNYDNNLNIAVQLLPGEIVGKPGTTVEAQFGQKHTLTGGVELNQKLYDQSLITAVKAADASNDFYALNTKKSKEDIIFQITSDYYQALIIEENLRIMYANQEKIEKLIEVAEYQHQAGVIKTVDLNRLRVNLTNGETQILSRESELANQKNKLKFDMGLDINQSIELDVSSDLLSESKVVMAIAVGDVPQARTEYQLIKQRQLLNELEAKNYKAGYYPTFSAYARYSYNAQRNEFNFLDASQPWFNASVVGVKLNIPIFDGFKKRSQVKQSKARLDKLDQDEANLNLAIDMEFQNSLHQLTNNKKSLEAQKLNVTLAEEVYQVTEDSYKEGIIPLSDLLNSETELLTANKNYNEALLNFKLAQLQILKAKGQLLTILN